MKDHPDKDSLEERPPLFEIFFFSLSLSLSLFLKPFPEDFYSDQSLTKDLTCETIFA